MSRQPTSGVPNNTALIFSELMDAKSLFLTNNADGWYLWRAIRPRSTDTTSWFGAAIKCSSGLTYPVNNAEWGTDYVNRQVFVPRQKTTAARPDRPTRLSLCSSEI